MATPEGPPFQPKSTLRLPQKRSLGHCVLLSGTEGLQKKLFDTCPANSLSRLSLRPICGVSRGTDPTTPTATRCQQTRGPLPVRRGRREGGPSRGKEARPRQRWETPAVPRRATAPTTAGPPGHSAQHRPAPGGNGRRKTGPYQTGGGNGAVFYPPPPGISNPVADFRLEPQQPLAGCCEGTFTEMTLRRRGSRRPRCRLPLGRCQPQT